MITTPWFSLDEKLAAEKTAVHHHNTTCRAGQRVEKNRRRYGTDNRPLCEACAKLDAAGR